MELDSQDEQPGLDHDAGFTADGAIDTLGADHPTSPDGQPLSCPTDLPGPALLTVPTQIAAPRCMDATEVSNAQYAVFLASNPSTKNQQPRCAANDSFVPLFLWPPTGRELRPVVNVDWCDAWAYCAWAGKGLCGNIKGGAGSFGNTDSPGQSAWFDVCSSGGKRDYPYGSGSSYEPASCNGLDKHESDTTEVDGPALCEGPIDGLMNLSGNVWEWEDACQGDGVDDLCRVRGGSFRSAGFNLRCDSASSGHRGDAYDDFGFRCCWP